MKTEEILELAEEYDKKTTALLREKKSRINSIEEGSIVSMANWNVFETSIKNLFSKEEEKVFWESIPEIHNIIYTVGDINHIIKSIKKKDKEYDDCFFGPGGYVEMTLIFKRKMMEYLKQQQVIDNLKTTRKHEPSGKASRARKGIELSVSDTYSDLFSELLVSLLEASHKDTTHLQRTFASGCKKIWNSSELSRNEKEVLRNNLEERYNELKEKTPKRSAYRKKVLKILKEKNVEETNQEI